MFDVTSANIGKALSDAKDLADFKRQFNTKDETFQESIAEVGRMRAMGLSPEVAERLFQAFVRTKDEGMGVGLSICHTIIEGHEGQIWAEPSELGGTVFHFTLIDVVGDEDDGEEPHDTSG